MSATTSTQIHDEMPHIEALPVPVERGLPEECRSRAHIAAVVAVICTVVFVVAMIDIAGSRAPGTADEGGSLPPAGWVGLAACMIAVVATFFAVQFRIIARVLHGAHWRISPHTEVTIGSGKCTRSFLHLQATNRWYRQSCKLLASVSLHRHPEVEWAGDPDGRIVVRIPGRRWLTLLRVERKR